ncbi:hypothetical protein [Amycolatopsis mediterranei]|uniref:hypothetical protein n=1 Tax=Amycolatopsis mediterranei TaxID=33910 RepID=UPI00114CCD73|nr:hypothetical protein [Amycolatopsis mediterranei]UZF73502.1 hypothetical protein ISP_006949 [Amycolatopsis mediterranei]
MCTFRDGDALAERRQENVRRARAIGGGVGRSGCVGRARGDLGRRISGCGWHGAPEGLPHLQQRGERLGEVGPLNGAILPDVELLEEALVDLAADVVRRAEVGDLAVASRSQCPVQGGFNVGRDDLGGFDLTFSLGERAS